MPTIKTLSQSMINKIAAGEVIERPASVVKELLENSLDAGASRVDVIAESGGMDLIRVVDNGCGIDSEQLPLALMPHSTSKLRESDDLFRILSFGFRGEALASVAEISQFTLRSRANGSESGSEIRCNGGEMQPSIPCGHPVGTTIDVANIFFNMPVRRKFLRSVTTEFGHVSEAFIRLAIPHPKSHFTLSHQGKTIFDLPPESDPLNRIAKLFGVETAENLIYVENIRNGIRVFGHISHPQTNRNSNRMQYFFLNNRHVRDRALQHALIEAYKGMLPNGRYPLAFLHVEMSPDQVDVNVHPTKMEVRFLDSNRVYTSFLGAIRERFLTMDLSTRISQNDTEDEKSVFDKAAVEEIRKSVVDWASGIGQKVEGRGQKEETTPKNEPLRLHPFVNPYPIASRPQPSTLSPQPSALCPLPSALKMLQMHDAFVVLETKDGIGIIDQHALHERILYDKMKERINAGTLESQRLLVPEPVDLSASEMACVRENEDFLKTMGFSVEPFGGNTILITGYPSVLGRMPAKEAFEALLEPLVTLGKKCEASELIERALSSMACKAAVKAGEKLREEAAVALGDIALHGTQSKFCPHGRPAVIVFSCPELNRMFKRT